MPASGGGGEPLGSQTQYKKAATDVLPAGKPLMMMLRSF